MVNKESYIKTLADHICVSVEDLTATELSLIEKAYSIFEGNMDELKANKDEVKRLNLELSNIKSMGTADDLRYEYKNTGMCPTCGRDKNIGDEG